MDESFCHSSTSGLYWHITMYPSPCRLIFSAVLTVAAILPVLGQQSSLKFDNLTMQQGLSDNYIICAMQDRYGFLWFGTRDGLNRYDGNRCRVYRHDIDNPRSVSDASINCLFEDRDGTLWIGTHAGGLNRFDRASESFTRFLHDPRDPASIPNGLIRSICEDDRGMLWVAADGPGGGLCRFDKKRGRCIRYHHDPDNPRSLSSNRASFVCRDSSGNIWVGTADGGLNRYDLHGDDFINSSTNPAYGFEKTGQIISIHPDNHGTLWMRSFQEIRRLNIGSSVITNYTGTLPQFRAISSNLIYSLFKDNSDFLWIGTGFSGLHVFNLGTGAITGATYNPANPQSIGSNQVLCITRDRSGNVWIGTDNGIARLNRRSWNLHYIQHDPFNSSSLSGRIVRSVLKDQSGALWIGTEAEGLNRVDEANGRVVRYGVLHGEGAHSNINTMYQERSGDLWIGSSGGLSRYIRRSGAFTKYRDPSGASGPEHVWAIKEDRNGTLWAGSFSGLNRIDKFSGTRTIYAHMPDDPGSISNDKILSLHEDKKGNIWVGTDDGLNRLEQSTGRFVHYRHNPADPQSLSNNRVWSIHEDSCGYLWIGTSGGGLNRFNPLTGHAIRFTEKEGLASNTVCGILEDALGRLWISTNNGISRLDPRTGRFKNYSVQDGFYINRLAFKACFRDSAGYLYFGGAGGVISFHPDSVEDNPHIPSLMLTSFKVLDKELKLDSSIMVKREIRLDHTSNFFTIEFAALDFTNPDGNLYSYQLENFDEVWRSTDGSRSYAEYTDVPPGHYLFRLRGANSDGIWNAEGIVIALVIEPAYWQTWWFQTTLALLGIGVVFALIIVRIGNVRKKAELQRKLVEYQLQALRAQMNPHFIFNALNSILHFIVRHDSEAAHHYLSKFATLIRLILNHSKSHLILLAEDLEALRFYIELERLRFDRKFSYEFSLAPEIDPYDIEIPPMLIQPYVENAIKHGLAYKNAAGALIVNVCRSGAYVLCSVVDDGIGRKRSEELKTGIAREHRSQGMAATKKRLEALGTSYGGQFRVEVKDLFDASGNAAGTRVNIYIPMIDGD